MYLLTNEQMKYVDHETIQHCGISSLILMENAGHSLYHALLQNELIQKASRILLLVGTGNNGGDALVVARLLARANYHVDIFFIQENHKETDEMLENKKMASQYRINTYYLSESQSLDTLKAHLLLADVILDGILGIGLRRPLSAFVEEVITCVNKAHGVKIAIDIPTGISGNDGLVGKVAFQADYTFSLAQPKKGCYMYSALPYIGTLEVLDIGIPQKVYDTFQEQFHIHILDKTYLKHLKARADIGYKGSYGTVGILAGSVGMSGACTLSMHGASYSGVGKTIALVDKSIFSMIATSLPEAMVKPCPKDDLSSYEKWLPLCHALVVGPGWGMHPWRQTIWQYIVENYRSPIVVDADALSLLKPSSKEVEERITYVLTPHPGEAARLLGVDRHEIEKDRIAAAIKIAERYQGIVVLKGKHTVIASPKGEVYINSEDSPSLSTSGSGDVLAGIIGSFIAQGYEPFMASCLGVLLHGLAGKHCASSYGVRATQAHHIAEGVGKVLQAWDEKKSI